MENSNATEKPLRILHVLRAPLGGLFRHVTDLATEQSRRGHQVGIICDSTTGGDLATKKLAALAPVLSLGVSRVAMSRNPGWDDWAAMRHAQKRIVETQPDVVHGHGAKGGFYVRFPAIFLRNGPVRAYTPHGGSFNYQPGSPAHKSYMMIERFLKLGTDIFLFESRYIANRFCILAGSTKKIVRIVWNGISDSEFVPVELEADAVDFLYIGELRAAKGIDTFLDAMALLNARSADRPKAVLAGTGPELEHLQSYVDQRGLSKQIKFIGSLPARAAFAKARIMAVPSRAESLPYVVLEAASARISMVATNVGGITEIFGPYADHLIPCDDPERLAGALSDALTMSANDHAEFNEKLAQFVRSHFTIDLMVDAVLKGYRDALKQRDH